MVHHVIIIETMVYLGLEWHFFLFDCNVFSPFQHVIVTTILLNVITILKLLLKVEVWTFMVNIQEEAYVLAVVMTLLVSTVSSVLVASLETRTIH